MSIYPLRKHLSPPSMLALILLAVCLTLGASSAGAVPAARRGMAALAAGTISVNEDASMHMVSHHGSLLNEAGNASGSFNCPLAIGLNVSYATATITFTICRSGGSFSGSGKAAFYASGTSAHFEGTVRITSGTGKYAHVSSRGLRIQGSLSRSNYALSVKVAGQMHV